MSIPDYIGADFNTLLRAASNVSARTTSYRPLVADGNPCDAYRPPAETPQRQPPT